LTFFQGIGPSELSENNPHFRNGLYTIVVYITSPSSLKYEGVFLKLLIKFKRIINLVHFFLELMDYPDSDEDTGMQTEALATGNSILDSEDVDMGSSNMPLGAAGSSEEGNRSASLPTPGNIRIEPPARGNALSEGTNRKRSSYSTTSERLSEDGPDLPPIYLTVRKEKEKKMVTHNLFGGGDSGSGNGSP
jgi:hypothetical protein